MKEIPRDSAGSVSILDLLHKSILGEKWEIATLPFTEGFPYEKASPTGVLMLLSGGLMRYIKSQ